MRYINRHWHWHWHCWNEYCTSHVYYSHISDRHHDIGAIHQNTCKSVTSMTSSCMYRHSCADGKPASHMCGLWSLSLQCRRGSRKNIWRGIAPQIEAPKVPIDQAMLKAGESIECRRCENRGAGGAQGIGCGNFLLFNLEMVYFGAYLSYSDLLIIGLLGRDATKFKFEFNNVRTSNVFNRFEVRGMF